MVTDRIVDAIKRVLGGVDTSLMRVPGAAPGSFVRLERRPWVLVDVEVIGLRGDAATGERYVADVVALASTILRGTGAALPTEAEPDGPGAWREGIAEAVRRVPPPDGVLLVSVARQPEWRRGIVDAVVGEMAGAGAIVIRG